MNEKKTRNIKTRNLSVAEYFVVVQQEYLMAEFRRKIYVRRSDKAYYKRVMDGKREKIEQIAQRNHLDSIFTSEERLAEMKAELFDEMGKPKFDLTPMDVYSYYTTGNEFSFRGDIYLLDHVSGDYQELTLYSPKKQQYEKATPEEVCRIL